MTQLPPKFFCEKPPFGACHVIVNYRVSTPFAFLFHSFVAGRREGGVFSRLIERLR